jgi:hypothetical protein
MSQTNSQIAVEQDTNPIIDCLRESNNNRVENTMSAATDKPIDTYESIANSIPHYTSDEFCKDQLFECLYRIIAITHPEKARAYTSVLHDWEDDDLYYLIKSQSDINEMIVKLVKANI